MLKQCKALLERHLILNTDEFEFFERSVNRLMEKRHLTALDPDQTPELRSAWVRLPYSGMGVVSHHTDTVAVFEEPARSLQMLLPLQGKLTDTHNHITCLPNEALIITPGDTVELLWQDECLALILRVDELTLTDFIRKIYPDRDELTLDLPKKISLNDKTGASLRNTLLLLIGELDNDESLLQQDITNRAMDELLLTTLLHSGLTKKNLPPLINRPYIKNATLKRAVAFIFSHLEQELSLTDIAEATDVSPRTLQKHFHQHFGVSPMGYIRQEKLKQVRSELLEADPLEQHVGDIAAKWGFYHTGHFARIYQQQFGEAPSATLQCDYT